MKLKRNSIYLKWCIICHTKITKSVVYNMKFNHQPRGHIVIKSNINMLIFLSILYIIIYQLYIIIYITIYIYFKISKDNIVI